MVGPLYRRPRLPRRYRRSFRRPVWFLVLFALVVLARLLLPSTPESAPEVLDEGVYEVARVIDGDTLRLVTGQRVRLQGIDSPETVKEDTPVEPWGPEASEYTRQFLDEAGGRVRLTFGPERVDQYDRWLAFLWHGDRLLNEELVQNGLARAELGYRYSSEMKRRLELAQREAQAAGRGIWSGREGR